LHLPLILKQTSWSPLLQSTFPRFELYLHILLEPQPALGRHFLSAIMKQRADSTQPKK
jgi:hypothetical protein